MVLVLPDSAQNVDGILFAHFRNLRSAKARNIEFIIGMPGPGGGFVFFDRGESSDGWRFLEAAPADITGLRWSTQRNWQGPFISIPDTSIGIGTGRNNTTLILFFDATAPAALAAENYSNNGKTDWFLPSRNELNLMYENLYRKWRWRFFKHLVLVFVSVQSFPRVGSAFPRWLSGHCQQDQWAECPTHPGFLTIKRGLQGKKFPLQIIIALGG